MDETLARPWVSQQQAPRWESLGVINGNLISGNHYDYAVKAYLIPQTMAGVEIDVDSAEFQEWYRAFTTFPSQAISEAQHQINTTISKYVEGGNRTNRQKQGNVYGTERWRDLKITPQNRLSKVKSGLHSQLSEEIPRPIYTNAMQCLLKFETMLRYSSACLRWHMAYPTSMKTPQSQSISSMRN